MKIKVANLVRAILKTMLLTAAALGIAGFVLLALAKKDGLTSQATSSSPLLGKMLQKSLVGTNTYTAGNIIPPTNRWFSSLAFRHPSNPLFAWPLAMKTSDRGFELSQPQISATSNVVSAPFTPDISVHVADQVEQTVTGYDDLSVSFTLGSQNVDLLEGRLTRGSPFLFITLRPNRSVTLSSSTLDLQTLNAHSAIYAKNGIRYGVFVDNAGFKSEGQLLQLTSAAATVKATVFALPPGVDSGEYFKAAAYPLTNTSVESSIVHNKLRTTYKLASQGNHDALFGLLPFASNQPGSQSFGSFNTLEGQQIVHRGSSFSFSSALVKPDGQLDLSHLTMQERQRLKNLVESDTANLKFEHGDTYFGGKELYHAAQLLQLSKQLGMTEQSTTIQSQLKNQLNTWFDATGYQNRSSKYFYYDNSIKGIVGVSSSFGTDQFNDHHFHYGYFLNAAAILGEYDKGFLKSKKSFVDLLAKDIINNNRADQNFPYLRNFDTYVGHSWASGFANFADGQNQESSSEAVNAWTGAYQWARLTGNEPLKSTALTLYNRESQAAMTYWLNKPPAANYEHSIVPIVWSGKLDYSTFFSNTPEAKLGIQLIPMSPASNYLKASAISSTPEPLRTLSDELAGRSPVTFKDYLLMYQALYDSKSARQGLGSITPADLDSADSMSYLYAWAYSH